MNFETELDSRPLVLSIQSVVTTTAGVWGKIWVQRTNYFRHRIHVALLKVNTLLYISKISSNYFLQQWTVVFSLLSSLNLIKKLGTLYIWPNSVGLAAEGWSVWVTGCQRQPCCCSAWLQLTWSISRLRTWIWFIQMNTSWSSTEEWEVFIGARFHFQTSLFALLAVLLRNEMHMTCVGSSDLSPVITLKCWIFFIFDDPILLWVWVRFQAVDPNCSVTHQW